MKKCSKCKEIKSIDEFPPDKSRKDGYAYYCRPCNTERLKKSCAKYRKIYKKEIRERNKKWALDNPEKVRNNYLQQKYNITLEIYNNMKKEQDYKCLGCNKDEKDLNDILYVDHCHTTGKVRGLLCDACNQVLGRCYENPETLLRLIEYLKNYPLEKTLGKTVKIA